MHTEIGTMHRGMGGPGHTVCGRMSDEHIYDTTLKTSTKMKGRHHIGTFRSSGGSPSSASMAASAISHLSLVCHRPSRRTENVSERNVFGPKRRHFVGLTQHARSPAVIRYGVHSARELTACKPKTAAMDLFCVRLLPLLQKLLRHAIPCQRVGIHANI